jgi:hypothetical protein
VIYKTKNVNLVTYILDFLKETIDNIFLVEKDNIWNSIIVKKESYDNLANTH